MEMPPLTISTPRPLTTQHNSSRDNPPAAAAFPRRLPERSSTGIAASGIKKKMIG